MDRRQLEIRLDPHFAKRSDGLIEELDQYQIMMKGQKNRQDVWIRVGYVGKSPGSPICMIRHLSDSMRDAIKEKVTAHIGQEPVRVSRPAIVHAAHAAVETDDDE